jgi:4-hydroxy 2-oxovalerate aldolase
MDWIGKNRYSVPAIISALRGEKSGAAKRDAVLQLEEGEAETVMIIGGGSSVAAHAVAIAEFATRSKCLVIFASVKQLALMQAVPAGHYFALAGDSPAQSEVSSVRESVGIYLVPAAPRVDVELDGAEQSKIREVEPFGAPSTESHLGPVSDIAPLALALGAARRVGAKNVILAGFDGYAHATTAEQELSQETQNLIACFAEQHPEVSLRSATRTLYRVPVVSIYAELLAHRIESQE